MLPQLIGMNGIDNGATQPPRLARALCQLLGELAQRVPVSLRCFGSDFQRTFGIRIVRRQQNAAIGFDGEYAVTWFEVQPVGHVLG